MAATSRSAEASAAIIPWWIPISSLKLQRLSRSRSWQSRREERPGYARLGILSQ